MSFMFKPLAYDDPKAVNRISLPEGAQEHITAGNENVVKALADICLAAGGKRFVLAIDGYVSAQFEDLCEPLCARLRAAGHSCRQISMRELYKKEEEIAALTAESLPLNYEDDPVLLFGRLYQGQMDDLIDCEKAGQAIRGAQEEIVLGY